LCIHFDSFLPYRRLPPALLVAQMDILTYVAMAVAIAEAMVILYLLMCRTDARVEPFVDYNGDKSQEEWDQLQLAVRNLRTEVMSLRGMAVGAPPSGPSSGELPPLKDMTGRRLSFEASGGVPAMEVGPLTSDKVTTEKRRRGNRGGRPPHSG
jgi:hypothetical protein